MEIRPISATTIKDFRRLAATRHHEFDCLSLAGVESCERAAGNETLECKANGPPARSPETEKSHRLAVPTYYPVQLTLKRMNGIRSSLRWESNPVVIVYKYFCIFLFAFSCPAARSCETNVGQTNYRGPTHVTNTPKNE